MIQTNQRYKKMFLVQAIELRCSPTLEEIEHELLHRDARWEKKGGNSNTSEVSTALNRKEGRSPTPLISRMVVEHELHARIGGLVENMKLIMEHLNIRKRTETTDAVTEQGRASAQESSAALGGEEKDDEQPPNTADIPRDAPVSKVP
jgi:hypothetical protein